MPEYNLTPERQHFLMLEALKLYIDQMDGVRSDKHMQDARWLHAKIKSTWDKIPVGFRDNKYTVEL